MSIDEEKLKRLQSVLELVDTKKNAEELLKGFKTAIEALLAVKKELLASIDEKLDDSSKRIDNQVEELKKLRSEVEKFSVSTFASTKQRSIEAIDGLFNKMRLGERFDVLVEEYKDKVSQLSKRISEVNDVDTNEIIESILARIPPPEDITPIQVRNKLESLEGDERLDKSAIRDLETELKKLEDRIVSRGGAVKNGARSDVWHTGDLKGLHSLTVSPTQPTNPQIGDLWVDTA